MKGTKRGRRKVPAIIKGGTWSELKVEYEVTIPILRPTAMKKGRNAISANNPNIRLEKGLVALIDSQRRASGSNAAVKKTRRVLRIRTR